MFSTSTFEFWYSSGLVDSVGLGMDYIVVCFQILFPLKDCLAELACVSVYWFGAHCRLLVMLVSLLDSLFNQERGRRRR